MLNSLCRIIIIGYYLPRVPKVEIGIHILKKYCSQGYTLVCLFVCSLSVRACVHACVHK